MDKFIPPNLREKLWSVFLTALVGVLLAMAQNLAAAHGVECKALADPLAAGVFGAGVRMFVYSLA